jgi:endoglucanase
LQLQRQWWLVSTNLSTGILLRAVYKPQQAPTLQQDAIGGAYSDDSVDDEFYWAAAELYLTTSDSHYQQDNDSNDYSSANASTVSSVPGEFFWASVAALGRLDLATVSNDHSKHREIIRSVAAAADVYVALLRNSSNGYGALLEHYSWGSTSNHLNSIQIVLRPSWVVCLGRP